MIEWIVACVIFVLGWTVGRSFRINNEVTTEVTDPFEPLNRDWLAATEPLIHQLEVASMCDGVTYNKQAAKQLAVLLSEMAMKLDYARHLARRKLRETT